MPRKQPIQKHTRQMRQRIQGSPRKVQHPPRFANKIRLSGSSSLSETASSAALFDDVEAKEVFTGLDAATVDIPSISMPSSNANARQKGVDSRPGKRFRTSQSISRDPPAEPMMDIPFQQSITTNLSGTDVRLAESSQSKPPSMPPPFLKHVNAIQPTFPIFDKPVPASRSSSPLTEFSDGSPPRFNTPPPRVNSTASSPLTSLSGSELDHLPRPKIAKRPKSANKLNFIKSKKKTSKLPTSYHEPTSQKLHTGSQPPDIELPEEEWWEAFQRNIASVDDEVEVRKGKDKEAEEDEVKPRKKAVRPIREPTKLPSEVDIGSTCIAIISRSRFLAKLVRFDPGLTLASDRYIVQARDVIGLRAMKRSEVVFLHEPKIKTMPGLGGLRRLKHEFIEYSSTANTRAATPPAFAQEEDISFENRSREQQLYLIRPHLQRVIQDTYPPSRARVNAFYRGENPLYLTGDYIEAELSNLFAPELKRWLLRPQAHSIPDQSPRPNGSDRFQDLLESEKELFITNILLPESLIQFEIRINGHEQNHKSEKYQYTKAVKRLVKRHAQANSWDIPQIEAQQAMGLFSDLTQAEKDEEVLAKGGHCISRQGRLVRKPNYAEYSDE